MYSNTGKGEAGAPKEEQYLYPHADATPTNMHDMINRMLEVNGLSQISSFPIPDTSGQASVEITVSDNEAEVTEDNTETEAIETEPESEADTTSVSDNASVSEDTAAVSEDAVIAAENSSSSGIFIFIAAFIGAFAGVIGYKVYSAKKKDK